LNRRASSLVALAVVAAGAWAWLAPRSGPLTRDEAAGLVPADWFGAQRAFPEPTIPDGAWLAGVERARVDAAAAALSTSSEGLLTWTEAGPTNIGGRVTAIAAHPTGNPAYFGAANGGVFRSTDFGQSWQPIFDAIGVPSIGALAVSPHDANVLYVGTGEANAAVDNYDGAGVFRTTDGGASWAHLGLTEVGRIGRIAIDPTNPSRVYVAAMGRQFSTGADRGLYRSTNAGFTWTKTLFVNDSTGVCEVVVNPARPETLFAASWERIRRPTYRRVFGPGCGIWRSIDYGQTWTRLAAGLPAPSNNVGRIGLAIARNQPSTVYAQIIAANGAGLGLYRSTDDGAAWTRRDQSNFVNQFGGFGWYFGDVAVNPADADQVWALGVNYMRSTDGGATFSPNPGPHVDHHALWFSPVDPNRAYLGNDGGVFWSTNGGSTWNRPASLPITQFYAGTVDPSNPSRLMGGTQDNNTLITPVGAPGGWNSILGGDGFYCLIDPVFPNIVFAEYQNGSGGTGPRRSTNNGGTWLTPSGFASPPADRYNWCMPFVMSPTNRNVMLAGSQRVYRSLDNGVSYAPISGDLSTGPAASLVYGTITTLDVSGPDPNLYYAGTDDGQIWRTPDGGETWVEIGATLPRRWVTRVVADPVSPTTVYVTLSGFSADERAAHVFRSTNRGDTWTSIGEALPNMPANDLIVAPWDPQTLFVGTDVGVYATRNGGAGWFRLGQGMPIQVVADLSLHAPSRTLIAATHGRSQWKLDLGALPVAVGDAAPARVALSAPSPNPSRGAVRLALETAAATHAEVAIYDAMGRRVKRVHHGALGAGRHALAWDGGDERGARVAAGVYFVRVSGPGVSDTRRIVRID
jgi:photosystem II stability/assembly factor-like uncharacterized protein